MEWERSTVKDRHTKVVSVKDSRCQSHAQEIVGFIYLRGHEWRLAIHAKIISSCDVPLPGVKLTEIDKAEALAEDILVVLYPQYFHRSMPSCEHGAGI